MSDVINAHDLGIAGGYIIEAAMQWDIDQLKADNAKLRKELEAEHALAETLGHYYELAQAENAKLRELVADALLSTKDYAEKHGGPSNAFDASDWRIVHLRSRGRELGIEVGEAGGD